MSALTYLQINLIAAIALVIVRINAGRTLSYSWRNRALRFIMVLLLFVLICNTASWMLNGQQFAGAATLLQIFNIAYFAILEFVAFLWYLYVYDVLNNGIGQRGRIILLPAMPMLVFWAVLISNPWSKLIFYIDEQNQYCRGKLFFLHTIVTVGYVGGATCLAFFGGLKEESEERRKECRWMAYFAMLPLVSGIFQVLFYGLDLLLSFTTASVLMVYINVQQKQVTRDALTGLNNRRRLDQYLEELDGQNWGKKACHLILFDVNRFKKINDTYGHTTGDAVLKLVADQMKRVYGNSTSFLARYGGDEFVIILKGKTDAQVAAELQALREGIAKSGWADGKPWEITISAGCARYGEVPMQHTRELLALADTRMYEEKKTNR